MGIYLTVIVVLAMLALRSAYRFTRPLLQTPARSGMSRLFSSEEGKKQDGHKVPAGKGMGAMEMSPEDEKIVNAFKENQSKAARLSFAEEVRTLIDQSIGFGVLSTNSKSNDGYPVGSVVGFQVDEQGLPFFVFSTMSGHTTDVLKDSRASLTVMAKNFKGAAEGRVTLVGDVKKVFDKEQIASLREQYLKRHDGAYWIDFGDFAFFRMESLQTVRFIGGFAMAGSITPEEYIKAKPDPLAAFADHVIGHMNDDHSDATVAMVQHYAKVPCSEATITSVDRLGMTVKAKLEVAGGGYSKVRLPFPQEVTERKQLKEMIVQMTRESASAAVE